MPPRNTTTLVLHFNTPCYGNPLPDAIFTVRGIRSGRYLGRWMRQLIAEYGCPELDATIDVFHHHPNGAFEHSELTHCAQDKGAAA